MPWQILNLIRLRSAFAIKKSSQQIAYYANRIAGLQKFKEYREFKPSISVLQYHQKYQFLLQSYTVEKHSKEGSQSSQINQIVQIAGRISGIRKHGKTIFIDVRQQHKRLQIALSSNAHLQLHRGDIIGAIGHPFVTKKGELSLHVTDQSAIKLLAPCLWMLPQYQSLKDGETRFRNKHIDLLCNSESLRQLILRGKIISTLRNQLQQQGYAQVETPVLSKQVGGAIAKPFATYHNDHKMSLFMRIAPELYLKKLLIGGLLKVFEIGKNFRNQSIDSTHNPEFTSCELYCAYSNYLEMIEFTKKLFCSIVQKVFGVNYAKVDIGGTEIDFETEWKQIDFISALEHRLNCVFPTCFESPETLTFLDSLCKQHSVHCEQPRTASRLLDKLAGQFLEQQTLQPLLIMNHPRIMSPLAKPLSDRPHLTQRFQLFINGWEIVNSYTELNDPHIQKINTPHEKDFIEALEYGLMPCAGWGIGIDRFVMLLSGARKIQQVIAFPLLRDEDNQEETTTKVNQTNDETSRQKDEHPKTNISKQ